MSGMSCDFKKHVLHKPSLRIPLIGWNAYWHYDMTSLVLYDWFCVKKSCGTRGGWNIGLAKVLCTCSSACDLLLARNENIRDLNRLTGTRNQIPGLRGFAPVTVMTSLSRVWNPTSPDLSTWSNNWNILWMEFFICEHQNTITVTFSLVVRSSCWKRYRER